MRWYKGKTATQCKFASHLPPNKYQFLKMQLLHLINFLAVGALASPISIGDGASQTDLDSQSSPNEPNPHTELLEKRFNPAQCRRVGTTILRIGTSTAT